MDLKEIEYKNIGSSVRTPKVVTFISITDPYWRHTVSKIIEWYSKMWGGAHNLIIPTNGKTIDERYWKLLERYDPDYLYAYRYSFAELIEADPKNYEKRIKSFREQLVKQHPDLDAITIEEFVERNAEMNVHHQFEITKELSDELLYRLSPFYFREHIVKERASWKSKVTYPLTEISKIVLHTDFKDLFLTKLPTSIDDEDAKLLIYSETGYATPEYVKELQDIGIKIDTIPSEYPYNKILRDVLKGVDIREQKFEDDLAKELGTPNKEWRPKFDYLGQSPFLLSLLRLGKYYKLDDHKDWEEPIVLVVGDSEEDFCYYYSLSKSHGDFFWIPLRWIEQFKKAIVEAEKSGRQLREEEVIPTIIINALYSKAKYGHSEKKILLTSISLDESQLEEARQGLLKACITSDIDSWMEVAIDQDLTKCVMSVIELDNFTNQQTQAFVNGITVGRIETPKPKNFKYIDPREHRWITELSIDGYKLPKLHFVGHNVLMLEDARDVRASKEGISYHCPDIGYFGGEIDSVLLKPRMKLMEPLTVFKEYYEEAGYKRIAISDKGLLTKRSIDKFGSLDRLGQFLLSEENRMLIDKFINAPPSEDKKTGAEVVNLKDRNYLNFKEIEAILGSKKAAMQTIDDLGTVNIFHRGFVFKCDACLKSDWYDISTVSKSFTCSRCSHTQVYDRRHWISPEEPTWYYKLDEVVREGFVQHMEVPVMTMFQLKLKSKESFLYTHELSLWKDSYPDKQSLPDLEIDINCIVDGELIIGESKITNIDKREVKKYASFTKELKKHPDRIIFSTFNTSWSRAINNEIKKIKNSELHFKNDLLKKS